MCYNVEYLEKRKLKYAERYQHVLPLDWDGQTLPEELPEYFFVSGFAHPLLPIVKHDGIFLYQWGLIPAWAKDIKVAQDMQRKTLNAVGETVFEKPAFRKSILSKRCLLGVNGFYEWQDFNNTKYPYLIQTKSNEIFSLACIYETWIDKSTGEIKNTFSILTTAANPLMEKIHNLKKRMPLILKKEDEKKWIDPSLSADEIKLLIEPYHDSDMAAFTISKAANNARNNRNTEQIIERVEYPELN